MNTKYKLIISANIRRIRRELDLTQQELGDKIGVPYQYIQKWENGQEPNWKYMEDLAGALGVTVEQLTDGQPDTDTDIFSPIQRALIKNLVEEVLIIKEHRYSGICLEFPKMPEELNRHKSNQWNLNELALRRWEKTKWAFNAPAWTLEKFCREMDNISWKS